MHLTVNFRSTGKDDGKDHHEPSIEVRVSGLPPNPNGTKNIINFILHTRMKITPERGVEYSLDATTATNFYADPNKEHIEHIRNQLGDMDTENSVSDSVSALEKFRTPNLQPYLNIASMTDEEIAALARNITELSLVEFKAKQLASSLAGNSQE